MDTNQPTNILNYLQKRLSSFDIGMSMARRLCFPRNRSRLALEYRLILECVLRYVP
jgi:hypothetical protein